MGYILQYTVGGQRFTVGFEYEILAERAKNRVIASGAKDVSLTANKE